MIVQYKSSNNLRRQWRRQLVSHCNARWVDARKDFVAITFLDQANTCSKYIDINNLLTLLLFEDVSRRMGRAPLRFVGYRVQRVADGVQWGGYNSCAIFKDLTLSPERGGRGKRMDIGKADLLSIALKLDRRLDRAARHPKAPWPRLRLPRLWVGYRSRLINELRGEGPEFEEHCRKHSITPVEMFQDAARLIDGLTAYPLDWVSSQLASATAVFAEVSVGLRRQVCRIGNASDGLIGFQGASAFDFYNTPFRRRSRYSRTYRRIHRGHVSTNRKAQSAKEYVN
jgi:hypothetical protein